MTMRIVNANWTMSTPNDENVHKTENNCERKTLTDTIMKL